MSRRLEELEKEKFAAYETQGKIGVGLTNKPPNAIEMLQNEVERSEHRIKELNEELLGLYRRIHSYDRPSY